MLEAQIRTLQLASSVGIFGVLESLTLNISRRCSKISIIGGGDHFGHGTCYVEDCPMGNNIGGF